MQCFLYVRRKGIGLQNSNQNFLLRVRNKKIHALASLNSGSYRSRPKISASDQVSSCGKNRTKFPLFKYKNKMHVVQLKTITNEKKKSEKKRIYKKF